ncbi:MAG TPA: site-2 protease family protein [Candidatus Polarisedimenticolia bacterium]|jgi:membrane-associated protease RseP (regulator of RpoE activity)
MPVDVPQEVSPAPPFAARIDSRPRRGPAVNIMLLAATFITMTVAGAHNANLRFSLRPSDLVAGLSYSLCLVAILGAHEMGHYLTCRYYGVDASLPFFLPSFPFMLGTFGAFIRIRAPIPNRKVLFDVGVAGPIAGFVVTVPVLIYGILRPRLVAITGEIGNVDEPLLISWLSGLMAPPVTEGTSPLLAGPIHAAYVGCMATAFNLFPIGQLDGGHICYAISSRVHRVASLVGLAAFVALGLLVFPGWLFLATLLVMFGMKHPPLMDEAEGLSKGRLAVAAFSLLMLILCFIPAPFLTTDL